MNYQLFRVETPESQYGVLKIRQNTTLTDSIQQWKALKAFAKEHCVKRFLVDTREGECQISIIGQYKLAYEQLPNIGFQKSWKLAILASPGDPSHDFLEVVGQNAGFRIRVFKQPERATQWLLS